MKKFSLMLALAIMMVGSTVFAGSVDYLANQSAKYLMTFTRNASTDASADIVNYNPAGTALLAPGLYLDFSTQTLFKPYEQDSTIDVTNPALAGVGIKDTDETYKQDEMTAVIPNLYAAYNFGQIGAGNLAVNFQSGIVAGGGSLVWDKGTAGTQLALTATSIGIQVASAANAPGGVTGQSFEVSSVYYGIGLGAAYSLLENMISMSLGGRYVMADRSIKLDADFANPALSTTSAVTGEFSYEATGFTPIIGFDVKPMKELTVAARYEFETDLEFEYSQDKLTATNSGGATQTTLLKNAITTLLTNVGIADKAKANYNLPAMFALGAEYAINPELTVMTAANVYFLSQADLGEVKDSSNGAVVDDLNAYFGTGYEVSLGATYLVMPELKVGAGFIYTESGAKDEYFENQYTLLNASGNPPLDSYTIGLGATYTMANYGVDITLAGSWTHYIPFKYDVALAGSAAAAFTEVSGEYSKDVYNIGFGVGYKM